MPNLYIEQSELGHDRYRVAVSTDLTGVTQRHAVEIDYLLDQADQEALRWYLEDFLQYPLEPNPKIAARTEERMAEIGAELFDKLFASREMLLLWGKVMDRLDELRVEISTSVAAATAIPWELLRDPQTDRPLALRAAEFVRSHRDSVQQPPIPQPAERLRILLIICRPREDRDVPFRSVASHLLRGLNEAARRQIDLSVLRPPTFEQLSRALRDAKQQGRPFHIVHFDGHGLYADAEAVKATLGPLDARWFDAGRTGPMGFLLFENPKSEQNSDFIPGKRVGQLLADTQTPVFILNACRSAYADNGDKTDDTPPNPPKDAPPAGFVAQVFGGTGTSRAFGSLAQEVMDAGVAGVVAMRYNLWVVTATDFIRELYYHLACGRTLGAAVSQGRKQLHAQPRRRISYDEIPLQDWPVPVVFEAAPIRLLPPSDRPGADAGGWRLDLGTTTGPTATDNLPPTPDIGFIGRDETLLALDRAFDRDRIVLLHAYAGAGKTAAAVEFARWYRDTGGLSDQGQTGPLLFTSFEDYKPLYQVLSDFGDEFAGLLEQHGRHWHALTETAQRRDIALQVMAQIPLLWIWDNLEPVAGFPEGTESAWSAAEQAELRDFLRAARQTRARFLLTSRRDELPLLGDLPTRIAVPPMPMTDRAAFAEALAKKRGQRLALADWRPLLRFTEGNPLTLLVVLRQALNEGLRDAEEIAAFVERLRAGEVGFEDEPSELRSRSLAASLDYGFSRAFDEEGRRVLALLVFFQGFVDVDALKWMGLSDADWSLPELHGRSREQLVALLDRAAGLGLLDGLGGGYYRIHPALPWFFRRLFNRCYPDREAHGLPLPKGEGRGEGYASDANAAVRTFCAALGGLGDYYHNQYVAGRREVIGSLRAEEANLLRALRFARRLRLWGSVIDAMQGLVVLYDHTGRNIEWERLMFGVLPDFINSDDGPKVGTEEHWGLITQHRVNLLRNKRDWIAAERLERRAVEWARRRASPYIGGVPEGMGRVGRILLQNLAASLHELGEVLREQGQQDCVAAYQEAMSIAIQIRDPAIAGNCAFNLGHVYSGGRWLGVEDLYDLKTAEFWFQRSLELRPQGDHLSRAKSLGQMGSVAFEQVHQALTGGEQAEAERLFGLTLDHYYQALDLLPQDALEDIGTAHYQLGRAYSFVGEAVSALSHCQEAIRIREEVGDYYRAAQARSVSSVILFRAGRRADALDYARAALQGFQRYGERAQADIDNAQALISHIQG